MRRVTHWAILTTLLAVGPAWAQSGPRGPANFSPQESSPLNGGINLRQTTGSGQNDDTALPSVQQRRQVVDLLQSRGQSSGDVKVDQPVRTGMTLPNDVQLRDMPEKVGELYSPWRGFHYVRARNEYLVVDPGRRVVAILAAQ
jgi:hypothetical protein